MALSTGLKEMTSRAKIAASFLAQAPTVQKNLALNEISKALLSNVSEIYSANQQDASGTKLDSVETLIKDIFSIMDLSDPVGDIFDSSELSEDLKITKCRVPIGTLGCILDDNPKTIIHAAVLAIKSANALIFWSGKELEKTSHVLVKIIQMGLEAADLPIDSVQIMPKHDQESLIEFLHDRSSIDRLLLCGSQKLTQFCLENSSKIPFDEKKGVCHLYVDELVNIDKAIEVIKDSNVSTVLIHESIANQFMQPFFQTMVEGEYAFRLDSKCWNVFVAQFSDNGDSQIAKTSDWSTCRQSKILNVKFVSHMNEAIEHIQMYGTGFPQGILSQNPMQAMFFASIVDSPAIVINCSLRVLDEKRMNLDLESLTSKRKFHVVGAVGLEELMSYKWLIQGNYHLYTN